MKKRNLCRMKTPRHSFDLEMKMKPETILVAICQRQDIRIKKKNSTNVLFLSLLEQDSEKMVQ